MAAVPSNEGYGGTHQPRLVLWLWTLVLVVGVAAAGCGGCGKKKRAPKPVPKPSVKTQPVQQPQPKAKPQKEKAAETKPKEEPKPPPKPEKPPEKPPLPENISDWKTEEYRRAKQERDPRLVEAVQYLGEHFAGTKGAEAAARLLVSLIEPELPEEPAAKAAGKSVPAAQAVRQNPQNVAALVKAVADALAVNGSSLARQFLEQMIAGTLPTVDDKAAAEAALDSLAAHPSAENEDILLRVLTAPSRVRPEGRGKVTADELLKKALTLFPSTASDRLRLKLAEWVVGPEVSQEQHSRFDKFLQEQHPANLPAQVFLYQHETTPAKTKTMLEGYFTEYSSFSLAALLGIPVEQIGGGRGRSSGPAQPARSPSGEEAKRQAELPYALARQLWTPPFGSFLEGQLRKVESLEQGASLISLAGTFPTDTMRQALYKVLHKHREESPKALAAAGLPEKVVFDPGLLIVVKLMPRRETMPGKAASGQRPSGAGRSRTSRPAASKSTKQQVEEEWMAMCKALLRALCKRFHAAALAQAEAARRAGRPPDTEKLAAHRPLELHPDARVVAEYHLEWPDQLSGKDNLAAVPLDRMVVHYLRIEEKAKPRALRGYYERKMGSAEPHPLEDGGWLEYFRTVPNTTRKNSIDLVFSFPKDAAPKSAAKSETEKSADSERDLVVELLSIDLKDPESGPGEESAAVKPGPAQAAAEEKP